MWLLLFAVLSKQVDCCLHKIISVGTISMISLLVSVDEQVYSYLVGDRVFFSLIRLIQIYSSHARKKMRECKS